MINPEQPKEELLDSLFHIEADRFKRFRSFLSGLESRLALSDEELEDLEGMMNWMDNAADIAHDVYGHEVLFLSDE